MSQSHEEILRVFLDWKSLYAPKNYKNDSTSDTALAEFIATKEGGLVSFSGLNKAVEALGSQVLTPEKTDKEKFLEIQQKEKERNRRDALENKPKVGEYVPPKKNFSPQEAERQTEKARKDDAAIKQAKAIIESYMPVKNGRVDYAEQGVAQSAWSKKLTEAVAHLQKNPDWDITSWVKNLSKWKDDRYNRK
jgi:hypothetical protein